MRQTLGLVMVLAALGCGGTSVADFEYGASHPGAALPEGGEVRHERVNLLGMPAQTWLHAYRYTGPTTSAAFQAPDPALPWGGCVDHRGTPTTWPFAPIDGATYVDMPDITVTGPGSESGLAVVMTDPPALAGNSTFRSHPDGIYGGSAGGIGMGFNATLTAAQSTPGGEYNIDLGDGTAMNYFIPDSYDTPMGIGTSDVPVEIAAGADLTLTWTPPTQDMPDNEHTRKSHFNFTLFADAAPGGEGPIFMCFPAEDGTQVIPAAVIDAMVEDGLTAGLIVHANLTHYMEAVDGRRFDLVAIYCNIGLYSITQ